MKNCNNSECARKMHQFNKLGLCHRCYEIAMVIAWMVGGGMVTTEGVKSELEVQGRLFIP